MATKTRRVCPCYKVKPEGFYAFGVLMFTSNGGVLGYQHDVTCHPECREVGPGYCNDEVYVDHDAEKIVHMECALPIPKRAWIHCGPC